MKLTIFTLSLLAFLFTFSTQTFAVDFTVNLTTDQPDANTADGVCDVDPAAAGEQCTLRAAVQQANALAGNDRVLFNLPANSTITLTTANGGEIPTANNGTLEITGTGANNLTIDGGAGTNRIFYTDGTTVTITGVTLTGGNGTGAFYSGAGGAIHANGGSLTLDGVYVKSNTAADFGGGVSTSAGTNHRILNSTFFDNTAFNCGGFVSAGSITVVNSTFSDNRATNVVGGFCLGGFLTTSTLRNVTVTNNTANSTGGIHTGGTHLNFGNTIVAGNIAINGANSEIRFEGGGGTVTSAGGNLVGDSAGDSTNTFNPITYHPTDIRDINPLLGPLQNNGGTTPTHALLAGSPAIDTGLNANAVDPSGGSAALAFDQRGAGFPRIVDGDGNGTAIVDIGAFEVQIAPTAAGVLVGGRLTTPKGRGIFRGRITMTALNGETRTVYSNPFGYYSFVDVPVGETYVFSVSHKLYTFNQSTQVRTIVEETSNVNFVADH